ncbi:MAG TPA: T9SS type A sorting domain-containing protein [Rhodothermales bacterium]
MKLGFALSLAALAALPTVPSAAASHFVGCAANTGSNATFVVPATVSIQAEGAALEAGDEIAVYSTDGVCAGVGVWTGENLAITVWGDDQFTPLKDGVYEGEAITLRFWDASASTEYEAEESGAILFASDRPYYTVDGRYRANGIYVLAQAEFTATPMDAEAWKSVGVERQVPGDVPFTLEANYPNPFNPGTMIGYRLEESAAVRLSIANVLGQTVQVLVEGYQPAGDYQVRVDMGGMPSGLYLYRLESGSYSVTRTMLLSR